MAFNFQRDAELPIDFGGQQIPPQFGPAVRWAAVLGGLVIVFVFVSFLRTIYTDWLWFDNLGLSSVFVKILVTRIALFLIGALIFGALLSVSLFFAYRLSSGPAALPLPEQAIRFLQRLVFWSGLAAIFILSIIFGTVLAGRWELFLRSANSVAFGLADPVFNRDISFYTFTLPMYNFVQGWLLGAAIVTLLVSLGLYFIKFSLRGVPFSVTPALKAHVSVLGALIMLIIAGGHWLDRWELVLSHHGGVFGATYADVHARMPGLLVLTIVAVGSGLLMLVNVYMSGLRLLIGAAALWVVMSIVLGSLWPSLMQQFTVTPNEFVKEKPYIERNLAFTRTGFALDRIVEAFYPAETTVTAEVIQDHSQTISNIRLWDYRPLSDVYKQIQLIRPYYDFKDADVDRYTLDGRSRQVLLSAREIAPEKLAPEAQTWVNKKLIYTHGIGVAMSPVTEFTPEGRPMFFAKDIPADGVIPISADLNGGEPDKLIQNPRIYFGENTIEYVIVNTNTDELDYQTGEGALFRTNYSGDGGVQLSSFLRRVAYAWQFGDINILISGEITSQSRIQYRREIRERISTVAPFLMLDKDPYIVAEEGQLFWMEDAYTISDHYPYSDPFGGFNYIRNSVKITVDAFNGTMRFHVWDTSDPVVMTYARIFPDLFIQKDAMPASLQQHVRYPLDMFSIQAEKYLRYHMKDPQNFYNNEDLWAIPREKYGQAEELQLIEPYYVNMRLPDETQEEFVLLLPFTPSQRQNLIGWLAARSDGEHYGKLLAFNFPKDRQVDGTEQVEARIDNDQDISAWFTLRCAEGASCIRGNMLVIPIGGSLLYAEPIYIQATGVTFPELKRVILATAEKVVMEDTLEQALASLTVGRPAAGPGPIGGPAPAPSNTVQAQIEGLEDLIEGIKRDLSLLEDALQRLKDLTGGR